MVVIASFPSLFQVFKLPAPVFFFVAGCEALKFSASAGRAFCKMDPPRVRPAVEKRLAPKDMGWVNLLERRSRQILRQMSAFWSFNLEPIILLAPILPYTRKWFEIGCLVMLKKCTNRVGNTQAPNIGPTPQVGFCQIPGSNPFPLLLNLPALIINTWSSFQ